MIRASGLIKRFRPEEKAVLNGIDLIINDGEFISLMGRSGSGKSTLLYLLSTLDRSFEGNVFIDEKDIKNLNVKDIHQLRNQNIGFVFQFHYLLSELSALENILLPARKAGLLKEKESFAYDLLSAVGLKEKAHRLPDHLSGGEQQRVAIARALIMRPKYIFADEPTGNLDSASGNIVLELFEKFNHDYGTTIVYVTHDEEFGKRAKRQIRMVDGHL
jgi:ABC-type lipoprotein export system ATPase subunit